MCTPVPEEQITITGGGIVLTQTTGKHFISWDDMFPNPSWNAPDDSTFYKCRPLEYPNVLVERDTDKTAEKSAVGCFYYPPTAVPQSDDNPPVSVGPSTPGVLSAASASVSPPEADPVPEQE